MLFVTAIFIFALTVYNPAKAFINQYSIESRFVKSSDAMQGKPLFIRIFKEEAVLELWMDEGNGTFKHFKNYPICYFSGKLGPKTKQGDKQAPEGFYAVQKSSLNPYSQYYLSFNLGYPNAYDRAKGYTGDYLMVHGKCSSIGCYAMTNPQIEEIYRFMEKVFDAGQKTVEVHIFPFRMSADNMKRYEKHEWLAFWNMIKPAYDYFEQERRLPKITVKDKQYKIN